MVGAIMGSDGILVGVVSGVAAFAVLLVIEACLWLRDWWNIGERRHDAEDGVEADPGAETDGEDASRVAG